MSLACCAYLLQLVSTANDASAVSAPGKHLVSTGWQQTAAKMLSGFDDRGMMHKASPKRRYVVEHLRHLASSRELLNGTGYDLYEFGVFTGGGLKAWVDEFASNNIVFGHIYGFDSFQGLPESDLSRHSPHLVPSVANSWKKGGINTADQLSSILGTKAYDLPTVIDYVTESIGYPRERTHLIPGFFNESLGSLTVGTQRSAKPLKYAASNGRRLRPAMLVDIDCDIYDATVEALSWMIEQSLLVVGSVVYFDDWLHEGEGERKAHVELTKKYGIEWKVLFNYHTPVHTASDLSDEHTLRPGRCARGL